MEFVQLARGLYDSLIGSLLITLHTDRVDAENAMNRWIVLTSYIMVVGRWNKDFILQNPVSGCWDYVETVGLQTYFTNIFLNLLPGPTVVTCNLCIPVIIF